MIRAVCLQMMCCNSVMGAAGGAASTIIVMTADQDFDRRKEMHDIGFHWMMETELYALLAEGERDDEP